jgi:hypothetical protein
MSREATNKESELLLCRATVAGPLMKIREETEKSFTLIPFRYAIKQYLKLLRKEGLEVNFGICTKNVCLIVDEFVEYAIGAGWLFRKQNDTDRIYFEHGFVRKAQEEFMSKLCASELEVIEESMDRFYGLYVDATPQLPTLRLIFDSTFLAPAKDVAHV